MPRCAKGEEKGDKWGEQEVGREERVEAPERRIYVERFTWVLVRPEISVSLAYS